MCGIAGIVDLKAAREIDRAALQRMADALAHRGPDAEGLHIAPGVGLAHRRLIVIDREGGAQPFHASGADGVLVYNGEIYNYQALAARLRTEGVALSTRSDTEVLAEGIARHGLDYIKELRGMFAFGFWSEARGELLLARDRLGEKPLYYALSADAFLVFASEIAALAASGLVALDFDHEALADYFFYGFIPDPKSVYRTVRKLPPGSTLTVRRGEAPQIRRYWRPDFAARTGEGFEAAQTGLLDGFDEAVRLQMIADEPLGAFLSGGVDSSAVVASMAQAGGVVRTCTIGFNEKNHDERPFARLVAERYASEHDETLATIDAAALIDPVAAAYGEPFADPSALPTYLLCRQARARMTVALTGDGADELFAGYRRHAFHLLEERIRRLAPQSLRRAIFGAAGTLYPKLDGAPRPLRLRTTLQALALDGSTAYARAMAANLPERMDRLLSDDFKHSSADYAPENVVAAAMRGLDHPLDAAQAADLGVWLPGRMLTKLDRAAMSVSLETRAPFLDHVLVEWACGAPPEHRRAGGEGKRALKAALRARLSDAILRRRKQGFSPPVAAWLRRRKGPLDTFLSSRAWRESGLFDARKVEALARAHRAGRLDAGQELWTVLMFDAFLRAVRPARARA
ncbi:asparagine synthase (glutamine-hydrolyzing) [Amphiplicatus metriothermophilus]|uniref:asparagine synthase (glutamine-hydrolyzing) n=1 Tax=Amphiplicatus metriothermophilus TaxID=1519374 RepID=A0A239PNU8_9PROT|nr:asparagine synthase (glutamine-hydrolyzing) [Amphiplicatus metriothermophilus]MBB5518892.1 asparagine synthase (glutamine-hydrolyzing) [Amphiplicatus metriothermophilus]SNT71955.1 asparagine synthase (glutamine-hydrolysing) [Amphiplicatus metriothermophilus]